MSQPSTVAPAVERIRQTEDLTLQDIEEIRLIIRGDSVVDWGRLSFDNLDDVDHFLRINEFDPNLSDDVARLEQIRLEAVDYLLTELEIPVPEVLRVDTPARDLFLVASKDGPSRGDACKILKVMHIIHHLAGREARLSLPVSDDRIFAAVERKVMGVVEELRHTKLPVTEFSWSRKTRSSQITKLLAKKSNLAVNIYDKLRFRIVVAKHDDILPTLCALTRHLLPFNYTIPGESVNSLLDLEKTIPTKIGNQVLESLQHVSQSQVQSKNNEFSADGYRVLNFVTDMPVRLAAIDSELLEMSESHGHVTFVMTEFQLLDEETALNNERGESAHKAYKDRQRTEVRVRL